MWTLGKEQANGERERTSIEKWNPSSPPPASVAIRHSRVGFVFFGPFDAYVHSFRKLAPRKKDEAVAKDSYCTLASNVISL